MRSNLFTSLRQKKYVLLILLSLFLSSFLLAQEKITVKGTVLGEKNAGLAGVSVSQRGGGAGTSTDQDGKFTIQTNKGATLIFSFVGYKETMVQVTDGESPLSIQLVSTSSTLGEVVVVSYGTQKRRDITGSIAQISASEVKDMPVPDIGLLASRMA